MDRDVDLVSPLVTPLTYEGLIDETVGIENGRVRLDAAVLGSSDQQDALSAKMAATASAAVGGGRTGAEAAAAAGTTTSACCVGASVAGYSVASHYIVTTASSH